MTTLRTATVRPVAESEATGRVAEVFADIKRTKNIDFVPMLVAHLGHAPAAAGVGLGLAQDADAPRGRGPRIDA